MEKYINKAEKAKFTDQPSEWADSFEIEFLNSKSREVINAMSKIGGFVFRLSGVEDEGKVNFEGERADGTKIKITIEKGESYKSPAELAETEKE